MKRLELICSIAARNRDQRQSIGAVLIVLGTVEAELRLRALGNYMAHVGPTEQRPDRRRAREERHANAAPTSSGWPSMTNGAVSASSILRAASSASRRWPRGSRAGTRHRRVGRRCLIRAAPPNNARRLRAATGRRSDVQPCR